MNTASEKRPLGTRWCKTGITLAMIAAVSIVIGLGGGMTGALSPLAAFSAFGLGGLLFVISMLTNIVGLALSKGSAGNASASQTVVALAAGVVVIGVSMMQRPDSSGAPAIHDLTTDLKDPPAFVAIAAFRADAPNPADYLDDGTAELQQAAFPDLVTLTIDMPTPQVFAAAEQAAMEMGWELVAVDMLDGRIEATDTTYWFGFKDDVVIRIVGDDTATWVDIRSKSRVGKGDMGTNARRIRAFLAALIEKTGGT
jgi:hypothetical protein